MESIKGMRQLAQNARRTYLVSLAGFKQDRVNREAAQRAAYQAAQADKAAKAVQTAKINEAAEAAKAARQAFWTAQIAAQKADQAAKAAEKATDTIRQAYMFKGRASGLDAVVEQLQKRYPSDPLFKPTGRLRPNGMRELEFHLIMDRGTAGGAEICPGSIPKARVTLFKQQTE